MIKKLLLQPLYLLLLPIFFVLHAYIEHWLFIDFFEITKLLLTYVLLSAVLFLIFLLLFRNKDKAGLYTFLLLLIYFFFSALHDFIKQYIPVPFLGRYIFLLPFLFIILLITGIRMSKKNYLSGKLTVYLNSIFLLFIIIDTALLVYRISNPGTYNRISGVNPIKTTPCNDCNKPDIYFLVFDEYGSSLSLKEQYNYNNSQLDTFLVNNGYKIISNSKSNYNWTQFSMASILDMSYLKIPAPQALLFADYIHAGKIISNNQLTRLLTKQGYEFENYSVFDFGGKKAPLTNNFMPSNTTMITDRTIINTLMKDIGWNFVTKKLDWNKQKILFDQRFDNIHKGIDLIKKSTEKKSNKPRFIYGHLLMPHAPFYMNKMKRETNTLKLSTDGDLYDTTSYFNYLYYTNLVIQDISNTIKKNTGDKAVIIIMGDHGFRRYTPNPYPTYFQNMNAVYFPDKDYRLLYDSISGVNQFRVVVNKYFHQSIPLLKDSCIFLIDK